MELNVLIPCADESKENIDQNFDGFSVELTSEEYNEILSQFKMERVIRDTEISVQIGVLCHHVRLDPETFSKEDWEIITDTSAILRYRLIDQVGKENMSDETITFVDETDVGGDIEIYVLDNDDKLLHHFPFEKNEEAKT